MKTLIAALAALMLAAPALAQTEPPPPTLAASGKGEVMVVPDIAVVSIGVVTRGPGASAALADNSAALATAIAAIRTAGVADKDIGTSGLSISPLYQPPDKREEGDQSPAIVGYQVSNTVTVTIRDLAKSGALLDQVVQAGANRVNGIAFDIADRAQAEDKAITAAIAEAKRRGELMAEAAGVKLVRMTSVSASVGGGPVPVLARMELKAAAPVPVMPGEQSVTANASITWQIGAQ